jgi:hypothetical protein
LTSLAAGPQQTRHGHWRIRMRAGMDVAANRKGAGTAVRRQREAQTGTCRGAHPPPIVTAPCIRFIPCPPRRPQQLLVPLPLPRRPGRRRHAGPHGGRTRAAAGDHG